MSQTTTCSGLNQRGGSVVKSATAIANVLKMEGVEYLFCFPSNPLIEAAAVAGIRPILARTERGPINIADGYTRIAGGGKIGVVATQYGPGIENAYVAVAHRPTPTPSPYS
jgi:acetolactate synthase-1/2/3 large subunit